LGGSEPPEIVLKVVDNHRHFADQHGYSHQFFSDPELSMLNPAEEIAPHWIKVPAMRQSLREGFDWVFWIDTDSIFSDLSKSLRDIVKQRRDIALTGDCWDLCNTGHLFMRNTPQVHTFIDDWWKMRLFSFPKIMTTHVDGRGRLLD
jgi:hypothetical protein